MIYNTCNEREKTMNNEKETKQENKKVSKSMSEFWQKATVVGKKAAGNIQEGAKALSEKSKNDSFLRRMKKYNPLFPEKYHSEDFKLPNMIVIVDDAVRRDIDVCDGAIGWTDDSTGMEVLFLYDEYMTEEKCGINFIPAAEVDATYYVDKYDRNRYIRTDCIFSKAHEEKLSELKTIANSLGAKSCTIELVEGTTEIDISKKASKTAIKSKSISAGESFEQSIQNKNFNSRSGKVVAEFKGGTVPTRPKLKWFAKDDNINALIDMRCSGNNTVTTEILELAGTAHSTMGVKTACAIDLSIAKIGGGKAAVGMEKQATKEHKSKLIFEVYF